VSATSRLAKITRPERKMGAARLAPLKMVLASSPSADKILATKPVNDAKLFEETYDMVVLGAGPSGITAAISAKAQGRSVLLVDTTPENRIPFSSSFLSDAAQGRVGTPLTDYQTMSFRSALLEAAKGGKTSDWSKVQNAIGEALAKNNGVNTDAMAGRGIPSVRGNPVVEGAGPDKVWTVDMAGIGGAASGKIKARKVLVATGSQSIPAQGVTYDSQAGVFNGDSIQELAYFPSSMTIVANALSSLEYAKAFAGLGTKVTLVIENKAKFDKACAEAKVGADSTAAIIKSLEGMGVSVSYDDSISSADSSSNPSGSPFEVKFASGKTVQTNALLTLLGRRPNVTSLGLDSKAVGAASNTQGQILVDYNLETTATGVYASGDVIGSPGMPNNGLDEVHDAVVRMFGLESTLGERTMPERHAGFLGKAQNADGYAGMLDQTFPGAVDEEVFVDYMTEVLGKHGFNPNTSINLVSTCRDEICRPFTEKLDSVWGQSFNIASLGGFVFCGRTGFGAGMAHAPVDADGKERYVFWVAPHIAYGIQHIAGKVFRPGREGPSSACGALIALQGEITNAKLAVGLDPDDTEMSLLRQQVLGKLEYGQVPNLTGITYAAHDCVLEQVKNTAEAVINPDKCEYVIISGIQIHGALNKNFFWPGTIKKYAGGVETDLTSDYQTAIKDWKLDKWLQAEALNQVRANSKGGRLPAIFSEVEL
jgi:pyruvate/2-oxoglutarate dehydrogenase complex dihydrolipoamide dehydrogenase (E3) component